MSYSDKATARHAMLSGMARATSRKILERFAREHLLLLDFEKLACRVVLILGEGFPENILDQQLRDLFAETFDCLYSARLLFLDGYVLPAFAVLRRGFETVSLVPGLIISPGLSRKWQRGQEIRNNDIRQVFKEHPRHPLAETWEKVRENYGNLSQWAHPNRGTVAFRHLGSDSRFSLGPEPYPHPVLLQFLLHMLNIWFWNITAIYYHYRDVVDAADPQFQAEYVQLSDRHRQVFADLREQLRPYAEEGKFED